MQNRFNLLILLVFISISCIAQSQTPSAATIDSIKNARMDAAAILNPTLRQVTVSTDIIGRAGMSGELQGNPLYKGDSRTIRTTVVVNMPVATWGKNRFSLSGSFFQQEITTDRLESTSALLSQREFKFNKGTAGLTASFNRMDSLFGRPVFYMASATATTNDIHKVKRFSFLGTAVFPLKTTATTRLSTGLVVNIDPSLKVPAFIVFSYWHQFSNKIELNITAPSSVGFRRAFSDRLWVNLGTTLGGSLAFFELNQPNLPRDANYTTIDLKTGAGVEYRVGKKMIFGASGGLL
ncbi:MAG: hypothetical protein EOO89_09330, partial [Pedobacter sp.]